MYAAVPDQCNIEGKEVMIAQTEDELRSSRS